MKEKEKLVYFQMPNVAIRRQLIKYNHERQLINMIVHL